MDKEVKLKCPECEIRGLEHIVSASSVEEHATGDPWFDIAYCNNCGHVYGVFTKHVTKPYSMPRGGF